MLIKQDRTNYKCYNIEQYSYILYVEQIKRGIKCTLENKNRSKADLLVCVTLAK